MKFPPLTRQAARALLPSQRPLSEGVKRGAVLGAVIAGGVSSVEQAKAVRSGEASPKEALGEVGKNAAIASGAVALATVVGNATAGAAAGVPGALLSLGAGVGTAMGASQALHALADVFTDGE